MAALMAQNNAQSSESRTGKKMKNLVDKAKEHIKHHAEPRTGKKKMNLGHNPMELIKHPAESSTAKKISEGNVSKLKKFMEKFRDSMNGRIRSHNEKLGDLPPAYGRILKKKQVRMGQHEVFPNVRIAVFGRSGAGKTTLIRRVLAISDPPTDDSLIMDTTGTQELMKEKCYCTNPSIPTIIHDFKGVDMEKMKRIRRFLAKNSRKIDVFWYVISAADTRVLDDAGLLEDLSKYEVPLVLVMTHADWDKAVEQNMRDTILDKLLERVTSMNPQTVKEQMVRVANGENHKDGIVGLQQLVRTTNQCMQSKGKIYTWAASNHLDMKIKLEASTQLIMMEAFSDLALPKIPHNFVLVKILRSLSKIWQVSIHLESFLVNNIMSCKENSCPLLQHSRLDLVSPSTIQNPLLLRLGASNRSLFLKYSCCILIAILYFKCNPDKLDGKQPKDYNLGLLNCKPYEKLVEYLQRLQSSTPLEKQEEIRTQISGFFEYYWKQLMEEQEPQNTVCNSDTLSQNNEQQETVYDHEKDQNGERQEPSDDHEKDQNGERQEPSDDHEKDQKDEQQEPGHYQENDQNDKQKQEPVHDHEKDQCK